MLFRSKLQEFARDFGAENDCGRFIFDLREAMILGGTFGAYQAGRVPSDAHHGQRAQMIALVYAGDLSEHKFLETVAVNRGYNVRVFDDLDAARAWMTPSPATA